MSEKLGNVRSKSVLRKITRGRGGFNDLSNQVVSTFRTYSELVSKLSPYMMRNADDEDFKVEVPWIALNIKDHGMLPGMMEAMAQDTVKYLGANKNLRRLPPADPRTHRSFQVSDRNFSLTKITLPEYFEVLGHNPAHNINNVYRVSINGLPKPLFVENLPMEDYKHLVIRPKYMGRGMVDPDHWEMILYPSARGYMIDYMDK